VESVFWAWGTKEGFSCDCCIFDYTGLVYDGNSERQTCNSDDTYDRGNGIKKLSYYSLKLLIEKIKDYSKIEIISDSDAFIYKFDDKSYIAWSESKKDIILDNIAVDYIRITEMVPNKEYGSDISENKYSDFFTSTTKNVVGGEVAIYLDSIPIFIEEL
jgi:hypothetical protein